MKRARPVGAIIGESHAAPGADTGSIAAGDEIAAVLGATRERTHYGEHLVVRRWYSQPEACAALNGALDLIAATAPRIAADPAKWLFLDTETTGLCGGTGTYAFLVGVAWWDGAGLQVEQYFLRDYADEHSMLVALAGRLAERPVLVTFNGKSFDWPLLDTRYRMTRCIRVPEPVAHLDLLHPARRLWRLRLGSVRLSELERSVLGAPSSQVNWDRSSDVRSDMIPQIYFDYLRGGSPVPLLDVLRHNQMDLRGLAAVAAKVCALLDHPEEAHAGALELYGLSKLLRQRGPGECARARRLYERSLAAGLPVAVARAARRELAALAKRERDYTRATALWEELASDVGAASYGRPFVRTNGHPQEGRAQGPAPTLDAVEAYEQLAVYYEHRAREPECALALAMDALAVLHRAGSAGVTSPAKYTRIRARLERRIVRLERKHRDTIRTLENSPLAGEMRIERRSSRI
ncbi:MAG: ribonuclease H-like domain-containing protein [Candidatus Acidiferrales bacterium]